VEEIEEDKLRTFINPALNLLWHQKSYFGKQDAILKNAKTGNIRYGVVFQYGGMDAMISAHNSGGFMPEDRTFFFSDVSGWDRRCALLRDVYDIRTRNFPRSKRLDWIIDNTVSSYLLLPNGDVVHKREQGNNSGSGTTTGDNCIMHQMVVEYFRILLSRNGFDPNLLCCDLYGDDILGSYPTCMVNDLYRRLYAQAYDDLGFDLKLSATGESRGPVGSSFLGAKVVKVGKRYLPSYPSKRLVSSLHQSVRGGVSVDEEFSKGFALMLLSWYDEIVFNTIRTKLVNLLATNIDGSFISMVRTNGVPTRSSTIYSFWLGAEEGFKYEYSYKDVIERAVFDETQGKI
jgi:hypothetical protein